MNWKARAQDSLHAVEHETNQVVVPGTGGMGLWTLVKRVFVEQMNDHVGGWAASLAYHGLFAIFPFLIFLLSLLAIFHATDLVQPLLAKSATVLPSDAESLLKAQILGITHSRAVGAFTIGAVFALGGALWGISGGFRAVMLATNIMYGVEMDSRPIWKQYLISLLLALASIGLVLSALILVVFGPMIGSAVANAIGLGDEFMVTWNIVQWPVLLFFVLLAFALVDRFAPAVKLRFRLVTPGSVTALILWLAFSLLFSLYVSNFGSYNATYGSFAGLAVFLLYIYYTSYIVLLGSEVNQVVRKHRKQQQQAAKPQSQQRSA